SELQISAGIEAIFMDGVNIEWSNEDQMLHRIAEYLEQFPHNEASCAVHAWKHGEGIKGCSRTVIAGKVGGILSRAGASIDLKNPDSTFGILLDGHSQTVTFGWLLNHGPKGDSSIVRRASQRPFFKPVSLEPRLARLAVNLACGPLANGACLDPMTGTGGFTIEAIMSGRHAIGMDLDEKMIQGAKINLEWVGSESNPFVLGDATNIKATLADDVASFSGVVLDPPYGRNSQGSMDHHALLRRTLESSGEVVDGGLVLILPSEPRTEHLNHPLERSERPPLKHYAWETIEEMLNETGWHYENAWYVSVHRSLGRVIVYATSAPQD
ncbi:MAG: RsmD family RNA methyltransferase, partial [Candidatus Thermoplasmatota archaeon]|nr:RsmD family RNA methyltransferase [Candidatus Thermoplasmatota archaeon]